MWMWFVGVAMGVAYVLEASLKKLAPMTWGTRTGHTIAFDQTLSPLCVR